MFSQTDSSILNQQPQLSLLGKSASFFLLVAGCAELVLLKVITPQRVAEHSEILRIANSVPAMLVHLAENTSSSQQEKRESQRDKGSQDFVTGTGYPGADWGRGAWQLMKGRSETLSVYTLEKCYTKKDRKFYMCVCV